jgi:hypothetical protein
LLFLIEKRSRINFKTMFNRIIHDKICEQCGRRYKALMSNSRFCSDACRSRKWRENKREEKEKRLRQLPGTNINKSILHGTKLIDLRSYGLFRSEQELYNVLVSKIRVTDESGLIVRINIPTRKDIIEFDKLCLRRQIGSEDRYVVERF